MNKWLLILPLLFLYSAPTFGAESNPVSVEEPTYDTNIVISGDEKFIGLSTAGKITGTFNGKIIDLSFAIENNLFTIRGKIGTKSIKISYPTSMSKQSDAILPAIISAILQAQ